MVTYKPAHDQKGKLISNTALLLVSSIAELNRGFNLFTHVFLSHLLSLYMTPQCHFTIHHFGAKIRSTQSTMMNQVALDQDVQRPKKGMSLLSESA